MTKASKPKANYRAGSGTRRCRNCTMFRAPSTCTAVAGVISPSAVCDYFKQRKQPRNLGK